MARTPKPSEDDELNLWIGARVHEFREERHITLSELARLLGVSTPHMQALESGRHTFSASHLFRLAQRLERQVSDFFPPLRSNTSSQDWLALYGNLPARDRNALMEVGKRLVNWSDELILQFWKRAAARKGRLISLEGVDGVILQMQGERLVTRLNALSPGRAELCWYQYDGRLWRFMMERFRHSLEGAASPLERTLLFACERLHRQETQCRPLLAEDKIVVTPFFCLAPRAYQSMEGLTDPSVVQAVAHFLIEPDLIVLLDSDPELAYRRAVTDRPGEGEFYSPYTRLEDFKNARNHHLSLREEYSARGMSIHVIDAHRPPDIVEDDISRLLQEAAILPPSPVK